MLHGRDDIRIRLMILDLLAVAGVTTLTRPYNERRAILEELELGPHAEAVATRREVARLQLPAVLCRSPMAPRTQQQAAPDSRA
jgi:hypothetical protein